MNDASVLALKLRPGPRPVSALSAFLRTLQAAVREIAASSPSGATLFDQRPGPTLAADFTPQDDAIVVSFRFCDPSGEPLQELSTETFRRFMQDLVSTLSAHPQRDLWGAPVFHSRSGSDDESTRMREVLDDLSRLGDASLECGRRRIELNEGAVWLADS